MSSLRAVLALFIIALSLCDVSYMYLVYSKTCMYRFELCYIATKHIYARKYMSEKFRWRVLQCGRCI